MEATTKNIARNLLNDHIITGQQAMAIAEKTVRYIGLGIIESGEAAATFANELAEQAAR